MNLNLGCGPKPDKDFINYDIKPFGDVQGDCTEGLPFKNESLDGVLASHILEHIPDLRRLKGEIHRVLRKGGKLTVIVPFYLSPDAWGDDDHCRAFSNQSFFGDFWPGFRLRKIGHEKRIKIANKEEVTWIYAYLTKN